MAFGYIAPKAIEVDVIECSGKKFNSFRCARGIERKVLAGLGEGVSRSGETLRIALEKKTVTLADKSAEGWGNTVLYSYLGYSRALNSHILHVQYYEGGAYMVIHHRSGQQGFPSGFPLASPDGKHFLSLSMDLFAGYSPNNVEIWQVAAEGFRRVANLEPEWGPHNGRWETVRSVRVERLCYSPTKDRPDGVKPCGIAKVEYSGGAWKLRE